MRAEIPKLHNLYFVTHKCICFVSIRTVKMPHKLTSLFDTRPLNPRTLPDAAKEGPKGTWAAPFFPSLLHHHFQCQCLALPGSSQERKEMTGFLGLVSLHAISFLLGGEQGLRPGQSGAPWGGQHHCRCRRGDKPTSTGFQWAQDPRESGKTQHRYQLCGSRKPGGHQERCV